MEKIRSAVVRCVGNDSSVDLNDASIRQDLFSVRRIVDVVFVCDAGMDFLEVVFNGSKFRLKLLENGADESAQRFIFSTDYRRTSDYGYCLLQKAH